MIEEESARTKGKSRLNEELKRLQGFLNFGHGLRVIWTPRQESDLDGEVKDNTIHIYSVTLEDALKTLRHEFLDYIISEMIEPYKDFSNALVMLVNKRAYSKKEKVVQKLANLLSQSMTHAGGNAA
jgi:hypothetical protein